MKVLKNLLGLVLALVLGIVMYLLSISIMAGIGYLTGLILTRLPFVSDWMLGLGLTSIQVSSLMSIAFVISLVIGASARNTKQDGSNDV